MEGQNASENFVAELCRRSFLPFWSLVNPRGKKGKELCDILVVCENNIILISVKDCALSDCEDEEVSFQRWIKTAVDGSRNQLYGADRFLNTVNEIYSKDGSTKLILPELDKRTVYRIAIGFGSKGKCGLESGDFGKGFVHVFDEKSTVRVLQELDTVTDFTDYLRAKERFLSDKIVLVHSELDLLALYLQGRFDIEFEVNFVALSTGLWQKYLVTDEYKSWQEDINASYLWDYMVSHLYHYHVKLGNGSHKREELEEAVRKINLEPRINRIELARVLQEAIEQKVKGRMLRPLPGKKHAYVFLPLTLENWESKERELMLRCMVARAKNPEAEEVIGIGIGTDKNGNSLFDICYLNIQSLDDEMLAIAKLVQTELGYFKNL